MRLWFVTPAWRRYELSAICFEQRKRAIGELTSLGVDATCVVIADDENLDLARGFGFDVVERNNRWLGAKFNDGIEHALNAGAEWVVPIGSDSWIDPAYFADLAAGESRTSTHYALVESAVMLVARIPNVGPHVIHRRAFDRSGPRPAEDRLRRGFDTSLMQALGTVDWQVRDVHPLQYIGFRGERHITLYSKVRAAWGGDEISEPWRPLAERYPEDLVERARVAMTGLQRPPSLGRLDRWSIEDRIRTVIGRFRE